MDDLIYIHIGSSELAEITPFMLDKHSVIHNKPNGGLWACRYRRGDRYKSDWEEWQDKEGAFFDDPDLYFCFKLTENAKVLVISSEDDYDNIPPQYKNPDGTLKWHKVYMDYDAVEVTRWHGYWAGCAFKSPAWSLESWDVPSIVVFRNSVIKVIKESENG